MVLILKKRVSNAAINILMLSTITSLAYSQEEPIRQRGMLDEVVVTAQRREQMISDVPISMQAFTGETLKELGIVDTRDLAGIVPGFSFAPSGQDNPIYTMRGVGFDDPSRTANSAVGVYIDEIVIAYPYMTQGADLDLERIEVLKGPQGTLYGRNTTGGAINYIAKKPTDSLEFGVEAEYGRFERHSVESYVSGSFTDTLAGRVAFRTIRSNEGWQKSLTRPDDRLGKEDKQAGRVIVEWTPVVPLRVNLSLDWWRDTSEPQAPQPIAIIPQNQDLSRDQIHPDVRDHPLVESENNRLADWPTRTKWEFDNTFTMPGVRVYWDVTEQVSATLIAAYYDFETDKAAYPQSGLSVNNNEIEEQITKASGYSAELRVEGINFNDQLSWLLGVYISDDSVEDFKLLRTSTNSAVFNIQPGLFPISTSSANEGDQETRTNAFFVNTEYSLTRDMTLSVGARYTDETRKFSGCAKDDPQGRDDGIVGLTAVLNAASLSQGGSGGAQPGECFSLDPETRDPGEFSGTLKEDSLGGKVALTWSPTDRHLLYSSFSRGFKGGSFPVIPAADQIEYEPATQERVDSVELGAKTSWFDESLRINFAAFRSEYEDKQLFSFIIDPVFGPLPKLFNAPEAIIKGAEVEIQGSPLPGLFISLAGSYLETEVKKFIGINADGDSIDFSGNKLPYAHDKEATFLVNYRFPLPFLSNFEGKIGVDYSYIGKATTEIEKNPLFDIPSYNLLNARIGIADIEGRWSVTSWVRNATNEYYQLNVPQVAADSRVRFVGKPRTVGLTVSYQYF